MTSRREFLTQGGAVAGLAAVAALPGQASAADSITLGAIGCGRQGTSLIKKFAALENVTVGYVCDPDEARAAAAAQAVAKATGKTPKVVTDLRRVLNDRSIDAVTVAAPDHWHAPATILAVDAGKHVYVEKPCSHNLREGRLMVEAARRTGRTVQLGTQSRSNPMVLRAIRLLHEGAIGEVLVAKAFDVQRRDSIGRASPSEPPPGFDYDLWVGPAPFVPFQANRHHYTWHWWHDFGTGDMGNDGVHELDIARWGLGVNEHPARIAAIGSKCFFDDDQQFPDTQNVVFEYPGASPSGRPRQLIYEMRIWSPYQPDGEENGDIFYGTEGWMILCKGGVVKLFDRQGKPRPVEGELPKVPDHQLDFVSAIREGRAPAADIETGHRSTSLCHLGNIAARVGRTIQFDPATERIKGDDEADRLLGRSYRQGHWAVPRGA
ncbi:Gfo/Idh/MocA family protein [Paludisphaera rhizosphaerae]|uniref:Gfo/Idh/MocA family protein n=1 Tax=Paludisphaera rhizosphaerae TaxID=2711216 RepID=UPI0013EB003B|nr:Gfo/Idh/MocA family oxidoreductase [Paludisphaera rhizosphaerae]